MAQGSVTANVPQAGVSTFFHGVLLLVLASFG